MLLATVNERPKTKTELIVFSVRRWRDEVSALIFEFIEHVMTRIRILLAFLRSDVLGTADS